MAETTPITVALLGFPGERESVMQSAFAQADKWATPWRITQSPEDARVIIVYLPTEDAYGELDIIGREWPNAEIIAFSVSAPPQAKWHLERQSSGNVSIVKFSQMVLKVASSMKRQVNEEPIARQHMSHVPIIELAANDQRPPMFDDFELDTMDVMPFFDTLDTILEAKPNEKRKRFNES